MLATEIRHGEGSARRITGRSSRIGSLIPSVCCAIAIPLADGAALATALGLAFWMAQALDTGILRDGRMDWFFSISYVVIAGVIAAFVAMDHYVWRPFRSGEVGQVLAVSVLALLASGFAAYMLQVQAGRLPNLFLWVLAAPGILLARHLARSALRRAGIWRRHALVVGEGETAQQALYLLTKRGGRECAVADLLHPAGIGTIERGCWPALLAKHRADLVVLAMDDPPRVLTEWLVRDRVPFAVVPRPGGLPVHGLTTARLMSHDAVLLAYRDNLRQPATRAAKLVIDVLGAAALVVVLSPLLLFIALAIKLDGGSVFYAHRRVGADGRAFPCLKFRSMVVDGDAVLMNVLRQDAAAAAEWQATQKLRRDPRVTAIGRVLRATSMDELPQLFNVLRLEMSLVGPRPIVAAEIIRYGEDIHLYYAARPGLTGLWQVSGRSDTGYSERVQLDSWYVKNWSLWTDLTILGRTIPAVLKRHGAV